MTHPDRTAERSSYLCDAYGCPCLGSMSLSASGGGFLCFTHYQLRQHPMQEVTTEINRYRPIAEASLHARCCRVNPDWKGTYHRVQSELEAEYPDLKYTDGSVHDWSIRLEEGLCSKVGAAFLTAKQDALV